MRGPLILSLAEIIKYIVNFPD